MSTGDEVVYRRGTEVIAFLAPIDTLDEAVIVTLLARYDWPVCGDRTRTGGAGGSTEAGSWS